MKFLLDVLSLYLSLLSLLCVPVEGSIFERIFGRFRNDEDDDSNRYIVMFKNKKGRQIASRAASKIHLDLESTIGGIAVTLPPGIAERLSNNPNIELVARDEKLTLDVEPHIRKGRRAESSSTQNKNRDDQRRRIQSQIVPYGISMVQADQVTYQGGIKVCIIDSGYDIQHEDLPKGDNIDGYDGLSFYKLLFRGPFYELPFSIGGRLFGKWASTDGGSHGTHVAGTIAAVDNDVGVVGVAPGVDLYIVNAFKGPSDLSWISELIRAMNICHDAGANIINMSLGFTKLRYETNTPLKLATDWAYKKGMLLVASAGNKNSTVYGFPASFASVISVAAVDTNEFVADFSNKNDQVELAAPGVGVFSTIASKSWRISSLEVNITSGAIKVDSDSFTGSGIGEAEGMIEFCGLGGDIPCNADGKICLFERGEILFAEKVRICEENGGIGTIVYNNVSGYFNGMIDFESNGPVIGVTTEVGENLKSNQEPIRIIVQAASGYAFYSGTSMASPHVAGVAALVWSHHPSCANVHIRQALQASAKDLGDAGRDDSYGYGLVQAKAAIEYLDTNKCS